MLIYIRHGDDRGEDVYKHDRHLSDRGKKKAGKLTDRLIEKYGHPDVIYVSPYRRAIETFEAMYDHLQRDVPVHRDPRIAQHLSDKQRRDPRVSPETMAQVRINEDRDAFRRRVRDHVEAVRKHAKRTIWCVTHQIVIEAVAEHFDVKISDSIEFLDYVIMPE